MVDCILIENPDLRDKYQEIYDRCKKANDFQPAYYWTADEFLVMYDNPELYEKNFHKENKENINKIVSERLEQIQNQQDLASGKRIICPYCKSTNTEKISTVSRAVSVSLVGAASGKIGKQWHCKNCGSNF